MQQQDHFYPATAVFGTLGMPPPRGGFYLSEEISEVRDPEPMELDLESVSNLNENSDQKKRTRPHPKIGGGEGAPKVTMDEIISRLNSRLDSDVGWI